MKKLNTIRIWILKKLFTDDERYLLVIAIVSRMESLSKNSVNGVVPSKEYCQSDYSDLLKLKKIFSTPDFV